VIGFPSQISILDGSRPHSEVRFFYNQSGPRIEKSKLPTADQNQWILALAETRPISTAQRVEGVTRSMNSV
jgi:hypothetical protein